MNRTTNNICNMMHLQRINGDKDSMVHHASYPAADQQAHGQAHLHHVLENITKYGAQAEACLEGQLESHQEEFLTHLESLLSKAGIHLQDKLTISLAENNALLLQCTDDHDALLAALGADMDLLERFLDLRKLALKAQGLHMLNAASSNASLNSLPQYKMCLKGALSHFYLKLA